MQHRIKEYAKTRKKKDEGENERKGKYIQGKTLRR